MKNNKILIFLLIIPYLIGITFYQQLPDQMPMHFNINLEPNLYASKEFVVMVMPTIFAVLSILALLLLEKERENYGKNLFIFLKYLLPSISNVIILILIGTSFEVVKNVGAATGVMVGVVFMISGNYMTKTKINKYVGYRTKSTLNNEMIWYKVNRMAGIIMLSFGFLIFAVSLFKYDWLCYSLIIFAISIIIIPLLYIKKLKSNL